MRKSKVRERERYKERKREIDIEERKTDVGNRYKKDNK